MEQGLTTIATDGQSLAADGRGCRNDILVADKLTKINTLSDGSLLGVSGRSSTQGRLAAWLEGKGPFPTDCGEWAALHVLPGQVRLYSQDGGQAYNPVDVPAAIGSGCELATGAMLAGKCPQAAVQIAAKRDPFSGGQVTVLYLKSPAGRHDSTASAAPVPSAAES